MDALSHAEAQRKALEGEAAQIRETVLRDAQEATDAILAKAGQSAAADVSAITRAILDDDGKAFMDLKEENRMLKKVVSHQKAMITLIQDTLKQLVPDGLRKQIMSAFNAVWNKHPENLDAPKAPSLPSNYPGISNS